MAMVATPTHILGSFTTLNAFVDLIYRGPEHPPEDLMATLGTRAGAQDGPRWAMQGHPLAGTEDPDAVQPGSYRLFSQATDV